MSLEASRKYIGIDPSIRSTGCAVLDDDDSPTVGILKAPQERGAPCLANIRDQFRAIVPGTATYACIEGPSLGSVNRADDLGQVRGIFLLTLFDAGIPVTVVPPQSLKKFASKGGASKARMIEAAEKEFGLEITSDDIADALWLAKLAHALHDDSIRLTRKQLEVIYGIRNPKNKRAISDRGNTVNI